jgi:hypothetical protein
MSKKKKNRNKIDGSYSVIEHNILNSEAWKGLKAHTKWLYFEFKVRWYGKNTKHIIFTQREAKNIMAIDTFIKSKNKLIGRGFIDILKRGGLEKQSAIYGLSDRWKKYGTKDFVKVDIKKILPKIFKTKFKKGHKFMGNQFKKKEHL